MDFFRLSGVNLDLALEAHELLRGQAQQEIPGVREEKESFPGGEVTTITIMDAIGERMMGRAQGTYITIDAPELRVNNRLAHKEISNIMGQKLSQLMLKWNISPDNLVLLVGLGNWQATPDALGPRVIEHCLVTRHLHQYAPEELIGGLRPVSAIAPGVLGITGIETAEIIQGIAERLKPQAIIAIDALAAQNLERISTTIQIADSGIAPGSGVGNQRAEISHRAMGIPVIAIGVPTVVHAAVIVFEAMEQLRQKAPQMATYLEPNLMQETAGQILVPFGGQLTVTPKEIDDLIKNTARVLAAGINQGLHPAVEPDTFATYLQ
ncbi:MAG: GPR endopeptidase [Syntrophomonadaceae bacterium]|nr:GPR endopeptidase [Syntrophomonadaceae bacterium]